MSRTFELPEVGQIVEILRGRDRGAFAVVIGHEVDRYVLIADGDKRKTENPKKKNVLHLRKMQQASQDVADAVAREGRVTNAKLRYAMRQFELLHGEKTDEGSQEGGLPYGEG